MSGRAVTAGDAARARLERFSRLEAEALAVVARAAEIGPVGVSFSGGKDSTVVLDLVRRALPGAAAALFHSGAEMKDTLVLAEHYGVEIVHPRMTFADMARYSGWWGYEHPTDPGCAFAVKTVLVEEPSEAFVVKRGLRVIAMGLRGEESHGREMNRILRGELYESRDRTWHLCPIARWTVDDVWAYIAARALRYHAAYDTMTQLGVPRHEQRIGTLLGDKGEGRGSYALLRKVDRDLWASLASEFPLIRRSS